MISTLVFTPSDMPGLLIQADPTITPENAANYGPPLLETALKYQINTPLRLSHFLAQLLHESGSLKYTEELASGAAYEGHKSLGNTQPGDGRRFKGRGLLQLTGRFSYNRYGKFAGFDALSHPELLATLPYAVDSAGWFWAHGTPHNLNGIADKDNVVLITRLINGGHNGLASRKMRLGMAKGAIEALGAKRVQQALNDLGSYPALLVDGDLGPRSLSVIREFQSEWFLVPNGVVTAETWSKLKRD